MKNPSQIARKPRQNRSGETTKPDGKGTCIVHPRADSAAPVHGSCARSGVPAKCRPLDRDQTTIEDEAAWMVRQIVASFDAYTSKGRRPSVGGLPPSGEAISKLGRPPRRLNGNSFHAKRPTGTGNGRTK
jgi:hypothetical protein